MDDDEKESYVETKENNGKISASEAFYEEGVYLEHQSYSISRSFSQGVSVPQEKSCCHHGSQVHEETC